MNRNNEGVVASSVSPVMSCNEKIELYWSSNCECDIYVCIKMHVSDTLIGQTMESDAIKMRSIVKAVATHQINAHQTSKLAFAKRGYKQRKENAFDLVKPVTSIIHSLSPWILIPCSSNFWILLSFRLLPLHPDLKTPHKAQQHTKSCPHQT